jgi:hypothetical protein
MAKEHNMLEPIENPWLILGVSVQADDNQIRTAYLQKVKIYPPDRAPEQFERIRDAYEVLRDPQQRSIRMLLSAHSEADLVSLLHPGAASRRFVGPEPWWAVLNERE